ncbi:MAG: flagellar biosynthesis protein FlhB [Candidatus Tectomicrobia bacterium]|uniref:Flagellar biosynthetic protein FlhB n=1 Tax=Tectimicrobiota bacterium TaxID=2528274 RepID=A0A932CLH3_UNCTE|nr:flagellar biosynthesis protein FlhB [Candidatus Tectomicrobia bacterium]
MPDDWQERTEPASQKRREEARKRGQVAKSRDVSSVLLLLSSVLCLYFLGGTLRDRMMLSWQRIFSQAGNWEINPENTQAFFLTIMGDFFYMVGPLLILLPLTACGAHFLQGGLVFSWEAAAPNFSKLDPWKGFKNLFSLRSAMEMVKGLLKLALVGWAIYLALKKEFTPMMGLMELEPEQIGSQLVRLSYRLFWIIFWPFLGLAALDYGFQLWSFEKSLRMTPQEIKQEIKEREGDPQIKSRIRSIQREMARRRMMAAVPQAQVVITNPTRLAVALEYQSTKMSAPRVVAKGSGYLAQRIREIAQEHQVPLVENRPLAQALYREVEVGQLIPVELYKAAAEVLAYVYRLSGPRPSAVSSQKI